MAGQLSGGLVDHSFASLDQGAFVFEKSRHALRGRHTTPTDLCACQPAIAAAADLRGLGIEPLEECPCNRRVIWGRDAWHKTEHNESVFVRVGITRVLTLARGLSIGPLKTGV
jgi:hypothetical protein